jgi:hypothetical protein
MDLSTSILPQCYLTPFLSPLVASPAGGAAFSDSPSGRTNLAGPFFVHSLPLDFPCAFDVFQPMVKIAVDRELVDIQPMQFTQQIPLGPGWNTESR